MHGFLIGYYEFDFAFVETNEDEYIRHVEGVYGVFSDGVFGVFLWECSGDVDVYLGPTEWHRLLCAGMARNVPKPENVKDVRDE